MFLILIQVLLWVLVIGIVYFLMFKFLPKTILTILGVVFITAILVIAFMNPTSSVVGPLWQLLSFGFQPIGFCLVLLAIGALQVGKKNTKSPLVLILLALVILGLCSNPAIAYKWAQHQETTVAQLEQERQKLCEPDCVTPTDERFGAIVLLAQGTTEANYPPRSHIQLTATGDRLLRTVDLYNQQSFIGNRPLIIVAAANRDKLQGEKGQNLNEARDVASLLQNRFQLPSDRFRLVENGITLRRSAEGVRSILEENDLLGEKILLVTSSLNMGRARLTFVKLGMKVVTKPTNFYTLQEGATPKRVWGVDDLLPSAEALAITTEIIQEFFASIYYFLRGWLSVIIL